MANFQHLLNENIDMFMHYRLFGFEVPDAECRSYPPSNFIMSQRVGFAGDTPVTSIYGIIADLDKQLEVLFLRKVYIWLMSIRC
jgi:hypothetical protein